MNSVELAGLAIVGCAWVILIACTLLALLEISRRK